MSRFVTLCIWISLLCNVLGTSIHPFSQNPGSSGGSVAGSRQESKQEAARHRLEALALPTDDHRFWDQVNVGFEIAKKKIGKKYPKQFRDLAIVQINVDSRTPDRVSRMVLGTGFKKNRKTSMDESSRKSREDARPSRPRPAGRPGRISTDTKAGPETAPIMLWLVSASHGWPTMSEDPILVNEPHAVARYKAMMPMNWSTVKESRMNVRRALAITQLLIPVSLDEHATITIGQLYQLPWGDVRNQIMLQVDTLRRGKSSRFVVVPQSGRLDDVRIGPISLFDRTLDSVA